jgi:hypothetical protein
MQLYRRTVSYPSPWGNPKHSVCCYMTFSLLLQIAVAGLMSTHILPHRLFLFNCNYSSEQDAFCHLAKVKRIEVEENRLPIQINTKHLLLFNTFQISKHFHIFDPYNQ